MIAKNISAETTDSLKLYVPTLHLLRFSFLLGSVPMFWLGLGKHHVWPDRLRSPHTRLESSQICWKISSVFILTNATTQRQTSVSCLASVCHTLHLLLWKSFKHVHVLHKCPYEASATSSFNASVVCRNDESKRFIQGTRPVFEVKAFHTWWVDSLSCCFQSPFTEFQMFFCLNYMVDKLQHLNLWKECVETLPGPLRGSAHNHLQSTKHLSQTRTCPIFKPRIRLLNFSNDSLNVETCATLVNI